MAGFKSEDSALYFTDNGAVLCGKHLGFTAMMTGHDLSGQAIERVTPDDAAESLRLYGRAIVCETCRTCQPIPQVGMDRQPVEAPEDEENESDRCRGCGKIVDGCAGECGECFGDSADAAYERFTQQELRDA